MRKEIISSVKRSVIKVGSGVLTKNDGLNKTVINNLARDINTLKEKGVEVIVVSSGAIASGLKKVGLPGRPQAISKQQALAAIGQSSLIMTYEKAFARYEMKVAQILITRDDLNHRSRYLNTRNTIFTLLSWNIVPIINENDTVAIEEIKFGDNDNLSSMVTNLTGSDILINLTDIDGLFDKDPRDNNKASLIKEVEKVTKSVLDYAGSIPGFLGTGGMASKVKAAQKASLAGIPTIIANGLKRDILKKIFAGVEEGTLFLPRETALCSRKHWIAFAKSPKGVIIIDKGAEKAIFRNGKSLLPSGIIEVIGSFALGDSVEVSSKQGQRLAIGLVNYNSGDINKIKGLKTNKIEPALGYRHDDEVIHRDNLALINLSDEEDDTCQ